MRITVKLFGTLGSHYQGYQHTHGIELNTDSSIRVKRLIKLLKLPVKQVGIVTINGKLAKAEDVIPDTAKVKVFQPLAGG